MVEINWGLLDPNAYQRGYQQTQGIFDDMAAKSKQNALDNALRQYATNPGDPNAVNALAQVDPRMAIQVRQQQAQAQQQGAEAFQGTIKSAAEMIQRMKQANPQMPDEQVYGTVRQTLIQMRAPGAEQSPEQFDPQYYQGILSMAGPPKVNEGPSSVQEFEYAKRGGFGGSYTDFLQYTHPPSAVTIPAGARVESPQAPPQTGENLASPTTPEEAAKLPPGTRFRIPDGSGRIGTVPGGQTQPASGNFLDPLAPL